MTARPTIFAALWLGLFTPAASLFAMGTPEDQSPDIYELGEVVVTAPVFSVLEAGETVHEISAAQIKDSNARTVDEALILLSDVNVTVGADGVPRIEVRGFKARDILVLLDGVPINSAFDQQFDPSTIPVESIASIKVTTGASSVLYGQGGLGGVINITTKRGGQGSAGMIGFEAGDGTPYLAKSSLSGAVGNLDYFLSGSAYHREHFPIAAPASNATATSLQTGAPEPLETSGYRTNSFDTRNNGFLSLGVTPSSGLHLSLTGNVVQGGYGKPASAINNAFDPFAPTPVFERVPNYIGYLGQLGLDYEPTRALGLSTRVYYNRMAQDNDRYDNENFNSFNNPLVPGSFQLRNQAANYGASLQPKFDLEHLGVVTLGLSGEQQSWRASGQAKPGGFVYQVVPGAGAGSPPYLLYPVADDYGLWLATSALEYEAFPWKGIGFAAGYAYHWQLRQDKNLKDYSVSASLSYDLFQNTKLKLAFMRSIHFPTLSELYLRNTNNPDLIQEVAYHYQAGLEQKLPWGSSFKINGFYSFLYNVIGLKESGLNQYEGYVPYNVNFSLYRFDGFESSLESTLNEKLLLKVNFTLNDSRDFSLPTRDDVQYVPRYKFAASAKYDFDWGLTPFVSLVYVAHSAVYSKPSGNTELTDQTFWKAYLADYAVVNLKVSQKLYQDRLSAYLGADNLFNTSYEDTYGIPRPGRYIYGGLEYRFDLKTL